MSRLRGVTDRDAGLGTKILGSSGFSDTRVCALPDTGGPWPAVRRSRR